ncbi:MAG: TRAP transporter TatT component family protein, partial [Sedimenticola sp.]|nr:TRAP transporter TatT component family protein [Sedimenticola sp.]
LPKVELLLEHIINRTPDYDKGRAQLYLGIMRSQLPPALGGQPEAGRYHFEQAISYSEGRDLMAKVEFARRYARLVFNQTLHDQLLNEVLDAPTEAPDLTLSNTLAKQQAAELLADDYF